MIEIPPSQFDFLFYWRSFRKKNQNEKAFE